MTDPQRAAPDPHRVPSEAAESGGQRAEATSRAPTLDRIRGCLLGGALGDALGYPIEFLGEREIAERVGTEPPARLAYAGCVPALVSDDTQMALFTLEGLLRARAAGVSETDASWPSFLLGAYQRWYVTQAMRPEPLSQAPKDQQGLLADVRLYARRAPGNSCLSALAHSFMSESIASPTDPVNDSKGCGAIMRAAPFGLAATSRAAAFAQAKAAGALTHGHPSGYLSAAYFASLVFDLARGAPLEQAFGGADALLDAEPEHDEVARAVDGACELASRPTMGLDSIAPLGEGWVGEEALAIAVFCLLRSDPGAAGFVRALWRSVAHGGDSDSTGCLTGNLLGAKMGASVLPDVWVQQMELADLIERLALALHRAMNEQPIDPAFFPPEPGILVPVP